MTEPLPIRAGVIPKLDLEREMLDYCQTQLRRFVRDNREAPTRIAIVLSGDIDGKLETVTNSWGADDTPRIVNCSVAAALLTKRAME